MSKGIRLLKVICVWQRYDWDETLQTSATPGESDGYWVCEIPELALVCSAVDREGVSDAVRSVVVTDANGGGDDMVGVSTTMALGLGDGEFDLDIEFA